MSCRENSFNKSLLFFATIIADNPNIYDVCLPVSLVATLPFFYLKRCTLKLDSPLTTVSMSHENISNTVRLWKAFFKRDSRLRKLFLQPLCKHTLPLSVSH